jgi:hypothetical protein
LCGLPLVSPLSLSGASPTKLEAQRFLAPPHFEKRTRGSQSFTLITDYWLLITLRTKPPTDHHTLRAYPPSLADP